MHKCRVFIFSNGTNALKFLSDMRGVRNRMTNRREIVLLSVKSKANGAEKEQILRCLER